MDGIQKLIAFSAFITMLYMLKHLPTIVRYYRLRKEAGKEGEAVIKEVEDILQNHTPNGKKRTKKYTISDEDFKNLTPSQRQGLITLIAVMGGVLLFKVFTDKRRRR